MKNWFGLLILSILFLGCQSKENLPKETYTIFSNHYIDLWGPDTLRGGSFYILEKASTYVAYYNADDRDLRNCPDCGSPVIAFEFDPSLLSFRYSTVRELKAANVTSGWNGGFNGPYGYRVQSGTITGQKQGLHRWIISMDLPADSSIYFKGFKKTAVYKVR
ncbi:hypothetical protein BWI97_19350 [Siphonobacter sp. BAB-5405]|uniref:hypothetical protein n=1 Tax=Siphonobacter sp. BAB-5405 TaxID=1864825 RepID=UPI000C80B2CB|nr:hypothetical protein [Siphonobacter sp. BAB-5405]PMD92829.1 hypothetical protein BWI97_19350 [Siphonobacter sp. BAB-5405]